MFREVSSVHVEEEPSLATACNNLGIVYNRSLTLPVHAPASAASCGIFWFSLKTVGSVACSGCTGSRR